jgi:hypothetical protein
MLKTVKADMTAHRGFVWPREGEVIAPDWDPAPVCGGGLHGLLWGEGDGALVDWSPDAVWLVCEVDEADVVDLRGKVKVPRARVLHAGDQLSATAFLGADPRCAGRAIVGGSATAGYGGSATAGYGGSATAGDGGTASAGAGGTATAGYGGTATAGYRGTATAGYRGTATAGHRGSATAGYGGSATAGNGGSATAGYGGTATAGYGGTLCVKWHDGERDRLAVGYVGESGIEPGTPYRLDDRGEFVAAKR